MGLGRWGVSDGWRSPRSSGARHGNGFVLLGWLRGDRLGSRSGYRIGRNSGGRGRSRRWLRCCCRGWLRCGRRWLCRGRRLGLYFGGRWWIGSLFTDFRTFVSGLPLVFAESDPVVKCLAALGADVFFLLTRLGHDNLFSAVQIDPR